MPWNEKGTELADRVYCYRPGEQDWFSAFGWSSTLSAEDYAALDRGEELVKGDVIYKRRILTKSEELSSDWILLFSLMQTLDRYLNKQTSPREIESRNLPSIQVEPCKIRLVVWFDN